MKHRPRLRLIPFLQVILPHVRRSQSQHADERIDTNFRNGSVTAVGIILGFSLGFLSQWAANPIAWRKVDIVAAIPIVVGIIL